MAIRSSSPLYRSRLVDPLLDELFGQLSALMIVGPRAAGKTTTSARHAATTVRLDREAEAVAFRADPDAALRGLPEPVLLDEWQAVPGVLGAVKRAVDTEARPGRFLMTGSVRAELENEVWPGTGRLVRVAMYPMAIREQIGRLGGPGVLERLAGGGRPAVPADSPDLRGYLELALRGGFPDPALRLADRPRRAWLGSYLGDLLTHDLEAVDGGRRDSQRLRRYFEAYALNSAGVAEQKTIYDAAGVNKATAVAYEGLLESLLVAEAVPAWRSNRLKRLVHQPKRYLVDAALIGAALRIDEQGAMRDGDLLGRILETFVAAQLRSEIAASAAQPRLHHLRTEQGRHEIDLVVELAGERLVCFEVKATASPGDADAKHLAWLREELGERFVAGVVLHTGPRLYELGERIVAAPICSLWA
jgi:predicted AAA+ superfamily ATPase